MIADDRGWGRELDDSDGAGTWLSMLEIDRLVSGPECPMYQPAPDAL